MANRCCNCCANAWWCWANGVKGGGGWATPNKGEECATPLPPLDEDDDDASVALPPEFVLFVMWVAWPPPIVGVKPPPVALAVELVLLLPLLPFCIALAWYCCSEDNELVICCDDAVCCWCDDCCWCCCCCWAALILLLPPLPVEALARMELFGTVDDRIEPFAFAVELLTAVESLKYESSPKGN